MGNVGETLFSPTPFIRWTLSPFVLIFVLAMPFLIPTWTFAAVVLLVLVELACVALLAGFWLPSRHARVGFRVLAALVFLLYLGYIGDQLFELSRSDDPVGLLFRRDSPLLVAMSGMSAIGLPCLWYLVRGRFT